MNHESHESHVARHYHHAREKHPHFADALFCADTMMACDERLSACRETLKKENERNYVFAEDVLLCELWEAVEAVRRGRFADATEEIYDAVAVLLRMAEITRRKAEDAPPTP